MRRAWWVAVGCLIVQVGLGLATFVLGVFLKPLALDLGLSRAAVSLSVFWLLLAISLGSPVVGLLTEKIGARAVLCGGITIVAAGLFLFSGVQEIGQLYRAVFVLGVGAAALGDVPVSAVVARWFRENRGTALGLVFVGSNLGGGLMPIAAAAVMEHASWREALQVLALAGWIAIFPVAWVVGGLRGVEALPGKRHEPAEGVPLRQAVRTPAFWVLGFAIFSFLFYYTGVTNHLAAYLSDLGDSEEVAARRFGIAAGAGVLGKLGMGLLADRVSRRAAAAGTFCTIAFGAALLPFVDRGPYLLGLFVVAHGLSTAENVVIPLIVAERFGLAHLPRIYGVLLLAMFPGGAGGPVFAGAVYDRTGGYEPAFFCFAVLNLLAVASLWFVLTPRTGEPRPSRPRA